MEREREGEKVEDGVSLITPAMDSVQEEVATTFSRIYPFVVGADSRWHPSPPSIDERALSRCYA